MANKRRPHPLDGSGDDSVLSPNQNQPSLLLTERGTNRTVRWEADANGAAYVNVKDTNNDTLLHSGSASTVAASTETTISTFIASATVKVYKIIATGSGCTDFTLRHNLTEIGFKQTNIEMGVEFTFDNGYPIDLNDTLDIRVQHYVTGKTKDFKMFVYGA